MNEQSTKKWLSEEIKFFIMMGTLITSIVLGYAGLAQRIAVQEEKIDNIRSNHLPHIQLALDKNDGRLSEIEKKLERVITLLESKR